MIVIASSLCALLAFLLFGIVTDRHHERRFGRRPLHRVAQRCRAIAWATIALALTTAVGAWGWIFGPIAWVGLLMAGAATSFLLLNLLPQWNRLPPPGVAKIVTFAASET